MDSFTIFLSIVALCMICMGICVAICNCIVKVAQENAEFEWPSDGIAQRIVAIDMAEEIDWSDKIELIKLVITEGKTKNNKVGFAKEDS